MSSTSTTCRPKTESTMSSTGTGRLSPSHTYSGTVSRIARARCSIHSIAAGMLGATSAHLNVSPRARASARAPPNGAGAQATLGAVWPRPRAARARTRGAGARPASGSRRSGRRGPSRVRAARRRTAQAGRGRACSSSGGRVALRARRLTPPRALIPGLGSAGEELVDQVALGLGATGGLRGTWRRRRHGEVGARRRLARERDPGGSSALAGRRAGPAGARPPPRSFAAARRGGEALQGSRASS